VANLRALNCESSNEQDFRASRATFSPSVYINTLLLPSYLLPEQNSHRLILGHCELALLDFTADGKHLI
jgi:hypothetical protein